MWAAAIVFCAWEACARAARGGASPSAQAGHGCSGKESAEMSNHPGKAGFRAGGRRRSSFAPRTLSHHRCGRALVAIASFNSRRRKRFDESLDRLAVARPGFGGADIGGAAVGLARARVTGTRNLTTGLRLLPRPAARETLFGHRRSRRSRRGSGSDASALGQCAWIPGKLRPGFSVPWRSRMPSDLADVDSVTSRTGRTNPRGTRICGAARDPAHGLEAAGHWHTWSCRSRRRGRNCAAGGPSGCHSGDADWAPNVGPRPAPVAGCVEACWRLWRQGEVAPWGASRRGGIDRGPSWMGLLSSLA